MSKFQSGGGVAITLTSGKGNPTVPSVPLNVAGVPISSSLFLLLFLYCYISLLFVFTSFAATSLASGVELLWEIVATAMSYQVQRSSTSGGPYTVISKSAVTNTR